MKKQAILISACLLGIRCRFDNTAKPLNLTTLEKLRNKFYLIGVCPEIMGGLGCPRPPCEFDDSGKIIKTSCGDDLTNFFLKGAQECLNISENFDIKLAVLKSLSPSCGNGLIYDGSFSGKIKKGSGLTAKLLAERGIKIYNEAEVDLLLKGI